MAIQQKLLNLKNFLTIEEAQQYLSIALELDVSKADILQFALEGRLILSVRLQGKEPAFVGSYLRSNTTTKNGSHTNAEIGSHTNAEIGSQTSTEIGSQTSAEIGSYTNAEIGSYTNAEIGSYTNAEISSYTTTKNGFCDDSYFVDKDLYHKRLLNNGDYLTKLHSMGLKEIYFDEKTNQFYFLDPTPQHIGGTWDLSMIGSEVQSIESLYQKENGANTKKVIHNFIILKSRYQIAQLFRISPYKNEINSYSALESIPHLLIVKKNELIKFIQSLPANPPINIVEKKLHSRERNNFLTIIGALMKQNKINPSVRGVAVAIQKMTEEYGDPISEGTIRKILKNLIYSTKIQKQNLN